MRTTPVAAAVGLLVGRSLPASVVSPLVKRDERTPSMADWCEKLADGRWRILPGTYIVGPHGNVLRFERRWI